ncbi:hypothetical protein EJB05_24548, partial [Eragrostis curvula]
MEQDPTPPVVKSARGRPLPSSASPSPGRRRHPAVDRLSALDDGTLHAILALLPLRDAAATSALSRRWPRVFATLPRLVLQPNTFNRREFDDGGDEDYCEDARRWMHSLAFVLESRAAPYMGLYDDWFDALFRELCASGGLLELSITNTKYSECYPLPSAVYNCGTLTTLDLFNWRLKVPGRITGLRALRSLRLCNVVASDDDLRRIITRCSAMEHLEIYNVRKARNIVIRATSLEKLDIFAHRPLCISVKKSPRLDSVRLSLSYSYPESSWSIYDSKDSNEDYTFAEIEEMYDYKEMAEREHQLTDEVGNMVTFLNSEWARPRQEAPDVLAGRIFPVSPSSSNRPSKAILARALSVLLMNARVLKRLCIEYRPWLVKPEHAAKLEAVRNEAVFGLKENGRNFGGISSFGKERHVCVWNKGNMHSFPEEREQTTPISQEIKTPLRPQETLASFAFSLLLRTVFHQKEPLFFCPESSPAE